MARTIRASRPKMCHRRQRNRLHKVEKTLLHELEKEYGINLGNRFKTKAIPEPEDDISVAALRETSPQWKHDASPRPRKRYHFV